MAAALAPGHAGVPAPHAFFSAALATVPIASRSAIYLSIALTSCLLPEITRFG
jgi:hypothetical protein